MLCSSTPHLHVSWAGTMSTIDVPSVAGMMYTQCSWRELDSVAGSQGTSDAAEVIGKENVLQVGPRPLQNHT